MSYDVIVVGGGLGGLTSGAKLARAGKKVLLIEQHSIPGGCATTFRRKDLSVEVGLHMMDGLDPEDPKVEALQDLGIFDNVELLKLPEFYRYVSSRTDITLPFDVGQAIEVLTSRFPHEAKGIRKYFDTILSIRRTLGKVSNPNRSGRFSTMLAVMLRPKVLLKANKTLGQFLDRTFSDEDLKLVLLGNLGFYHDDPYTMSMFYYGFAQGSFFSGGGHFVKGGSQRLSDYLASQITDHGGEVLLRHLVTGIILQDGRAVGVKYRKTNKQDSETKEAFAGCVIANAAVPNVANELLPSSPAREKLRAEIAPLQVARSIISLYLGFKKPLRELGSNCYSTFVANDTIKRQSDWADGVLADFESRGFFFTDYSQIDSGLAPPGKGVATIVALDSLEDWEHLDEESYRKRKAHVVDVWIDRLDRLLPGSKEQIVYSELGTPRTLKRYTLNPAGTAYGWAVTNQQIGLNRLSNRSSIPGLYFASVWTYPGQGFTCAIMSGYFCAELILGGG